MYTSFVMSDLTPCQLLLHWPPVPFFFFFCSSLQPNNLCRLMIFNPEKLFPMRKIFCCINIGNNIDR